MLCESDYDVVFGFVAMSCAEEILWLDHSSTASFQYSENTAEVSNVSSFKWVANKRIVGGERHSVD